MSSYLVKSQYKQKYVNHISRLENIK